MLSVNDKEKTIYSRQITLPEVGEAGQEELQEHGVLIVGMGGLGCPVVGNNGGMIPGIITAGVRNGTIGNFISGAYVGLLRF